MKFNVYGLPTDEKQYDYGAAMPPTGAPLAETVTTYGSWNGSGCSTIQTFINDRVCEQKTYTAGQSTPTSDQRNTYDANGNLTQTATLTTGTTYVTKSFTYNSNGSLNTSTDGRGNATSYTEGACNGLLPTKSTAGGLSVQQQWNCNGEVLTSSSDESGNATTYTYNDPFYRPTLVAYPDGGSTTACYSDTVGTSCSNTSTNVVYTTIAATPSPAQSSSVTSDGLGRPISTILPSGATVTTTYDPVGNVASVSTPYVSTSDSTYGLTSYLHDALGRVIDQCQPDNTPIGAVTCSPSTSFQKYSYSGNQTTFTDEAGKSWVRVADGLGRLTHVTEPGNLATAYSYNALGDLTSVVQSGLSGETPRTRSFSYDGLGRLLASYNPETGSGLSCPGATGSFGTCYGYDANGNLVSKTDARNTNRHLHLRFAESADRQDLQRWPDTQRALPLRSNVSVEGHAVQHTWKDVAGVHRL